jgi:hypothetical protein
MGHKRKRDDAAPAQSQVVAKPAPGTKVFGSGKAVRDGLAAGTRQGEWKWEWGWEWGGGEDRSESGKGGVSESESGSEGERERGSDGDSDTFEHTMTRREMLTFCSLSFP